MADRTALIFRLQLRMWLLLASASVLPTPTVTQRGVWRVHLLRTYIGICTLQTKQLKMFRHLVDKLLLADLYISIYFDDQRSR